MILYRGDFLEGFYVRDAPDFEQWLLGQRAQYRENVLQGLHALAAYAEQAGHLPQAIAHTRRLLTLEPWREEAHRRLMRLLAASGQRATALAQYETCRRVLNEEVAVEPDAETVALVEAIRAGEFGRVTGGGGDKVTRGEGDKVNVAPDRSFPVSPLPLVAPPLPIPPTPLIGRERELAELGELIHNPQCKLITITGPGGIGKTRLALQAEHLHELSGLDYPPSPSTSLGARSSRGWLSYVAVQLFLQRVRQTQPRFTPSDEELAAIVRICRITEGMPLALELSATAVREQSCVALATALEQGRARLTARLREWLITHRPEEGLQMTLNLFWLWQSTNALGTADVRPIRLQ
jgi:hypothetical protein